MTRRGPWPFSASSLLALALTVVAIAALLIGLRRTAPHEPLEFVLPSATNEADLLTCERTVPDDPAQEQREDVAEEQLEETENRDPIGRVSSAQVVECPDVFDQEVVTYVGEVVGDVLERDGGRWMLVNDDAYALESGPLPTHTNIVGTNSGLSVWIPDEIGGTLTPGGPGVRGDIIALRGILHRTDEHDGGGLTIRAHAVEVVEKSAGTRQPVHRNQAIAAVGLAVLAIATLVLRRVQLRRR